MLILCRCNRHCLVLFCVCLCFFLVIAIVVSVVRVVCESMWKCTLSMSRDSVFCWEHVCRYHLRYHCISNRDVASCTYIFIPLLLLRHRSRHHRSMHSLSLSLTIFILQRRNILSLHWFDFTFADLNFAIPCASKLFESISSGAFRCTPIEKEISHVLLVAHWHMRCIAFSALETWRCRLMQ